MTVFKVRFDLDEQTASWAPGASELLWVEKVGAGRARIRNSPFFVRGVAVDVPARWARDAPPAVRSVVSWRRR